MARIFVGIPISKELQGKVLEWETKIKDLSFKNEVRWIEGKNLHITLVPPREVMEHATYNIEQKLQSVRAQAFSISFNKITFGPNAREPRMIWAAGEGGQTINNLRLTIYRQLGQQPDERPFRLHATLARLKNFHMQTQQEISKVDWSMKVEKFVLYESRLLPQGSDYEVLAEFPLSN
jgi:2'-5' RNA ligase